VAQKKSGVELSTKTPKIKPDRFRLVLILVMALLPSLITAIVIPIQTGSPVTDFFPVSPTDQNEYWHQIATFQLAGFNGGYYTHLEKPAQISESRFGVHGPFYILVFGLLSHITGWTYATPVFYNIVIIAIGFILFAWLAKLNNKQIILAGLAMGFFPPVLIYLPSAMQESTHQMIAMVFAVIFGVALTQQEKTQRWVKLAAVVFTLAVSLSRPSWTLLLFPLFGLFLPKNLKNQLIGIGLSIMCILAVVIMLGLFITPGNNTIESLLDQFSISPRIGLSFLFRTVKDNLDLFLNSSGLPQLFFRIEYMIILVVSMVASTYYWMIKSRKTSHKKSTNAVAWLSLVLFLIFFPIILWSFTLYFLKNDIRFIAPYVLLAIFLLLYYKKEKYVIAFILVNLLVFPAVVQQFSNPISSNFIYSKAQIEETKKVFVKNIQFQPDQTNSWCNTILLPVTLYDYRVALIPPGIGISYVLDNNGIDKVPFPAKSKYLILTPQQIKEIGQKNMNDLDILAEFTDGILYLNKSTNCSQVQ
jgi:hypothetical protein